MNNIPVVINDKSYEVELNSTILKACKGVGIKILTMCHLEGVSDIGACRLCLVEVEGINKLLPACTTKITANMNIHTQTEKLKKYQRITTELLFAERNHVCSVCVADGNCELQNLGYEVGMDHIRYPYFFPQCNLDASHSQFVIDHNRCIMCTRCVRVCSEVEGAFNWGVMNRGNQVRIISDFNTPWGESVTCTSCGKCMEVCPTGAIWPRGIVQGQLEKNPGMINELVEKRKMNL